VKQHLCHLCINQRHPGYIHNHHRGAVLHNRRQQRVEQDCRACGVNHPNQRHDQNALQDGNHRARQCSHCRTQLLARAEGRLQLGQGALQVGRTVGNPRFERALVLQHCRPRGP